MRLFQYFNYTETKNKKADNLILYIENYVNMATVQFQRMQENSIEAVQLTKDNVKETLEKRIVYSRIMADQHFFLNCIDKVYQMSKRLAENAIDDQQLEQITTGFKDQQYYRDARNHFEHMDDRLIKTDWFRSPVNFNNVITLDGVGFPLDERSLIPLYSLYEKIIVRIDEIHEPYKEKIDKYFNN
jgi:hypothetical protein